MSYHIAPISDPPLSLPLASGKILFMPPINSLEVLVPPMLLLTPLHRHIYLYSTLHNADYFKAASQK